MIRPLYFSRTRFLHEIIIMHIICFAFLQCLQRKSNAFCFSFCYTHSYWILFLMKGNHGWYAKGSESVVWFHIDVCECRLSVRFIKYDYYQRNCDYPYDNASFLGLSWLADERQLLHWHPLFWYNFWKLSWSKRSHLHCYVPFFDWLWHVLFISERQ